MSTTDESASTTDGLGSVEPFVESSPTTAAGAAAAAAAAAGVEVASASNREGSRGQLKQSQPEAKHTRLETSRSRLWVNIMCGTVKISKWIPVCT